MGEGSAQQVRALRDRLDGLTLRDAARETEALQAIREHGHHDASYVPDKNDLPEALERVVRPGIVTPR